MRMAAVMAAGMTVVALSGSALAQGKKEFDPGSDSPAAQSAPAPFDMQVYGPGLISCATYLNDRSIRINADGWILGFWTGSNRTNPENHQVGRSTDSRGIVGEVALACRNHPSVTIFATEREVYDRMKGEGR